MKTIDIYGNYLDKNNPYLPIILAMEKDPRLQINLMGPAHRSLLEIQRRKYVKGKIAIGFGTPREFSGMHMGSYRAKLGYISWETNKVPYGSSYGFKKSLQDLDLLMVPNEWQELLFEHTGAFIKVVPPVYSMADFNKLSRHFEDPFTFLSVGKLTHKTNVGYLISAVMSLARIHPNIKLILKTEGGTLGHLNFPEQFIEIIDGDISRSELINLYNNSDCFVYPTSADANPTFLFNAINAGLSIIAPSHSNFDPQNVLRNHELIPAKRYSKKLEDVGSYWSIDYDELVTEMQNAIEEKNTYYGSNTSFQSPEAFVDDVYALIKKI